MVRRNIPDVVNDLTAITRAARQAAAEWVDLRERQRVAAARVTPEKPRVRRPSAERRAATAKKDEEDGLVISPWTGKAHAWRQVLGREVLRPETDAHHFVQPASEAGTVFPVVRRHGVHSPRNLYRAPVKESPTSDDAPANIPTHAADEGSPNGVLNETPDDGPSDSPPPGVDTNVFRTIKGSKILGTLNREKAKVRPPPKREVRYPAPWADVKSSANPGNEASAETSPQSQTAPDNEASLGATSLHQPTPTNEASTTATVQNQPAPAVAQVQPAVPPEAVAPQLADNVAQPNPLRSRAYELRESKVPSTRVGRLWNYGGLAAGMLGGALTESLTRVVGGGGGSQGSVMLSPANMDRLVSRLSRMRGAALKMGQMMSFQDAKMLPGPIHEVLQRVQDRADYMPSYQRDKVLIENLGSEWRELFSEFEEKPIAAASIGQVHRATLKSNGKAVAVKIQFPGVADSINSDLDNLGILLAATKLLPKGLYLDKTIDNARTELGWECDYSREAECLTRFGALMADETDVFRVPAVHAEASGKQVLTMDFMRGEPVTRLAELSQAQRDWIGTQILRLCLREITEFRFMQTDPNWTNFLYNAAEGRLELLDFGASREYPQAFVTQYVRLLEAASRSDRAGVKALSEELGYLTGLESRTMLDAHVGSVLTLAEPFLGSAPEVYDFHDQTITERVKGYIPVMLKERLAPPPEETYSLHRKLSGAFLLCARLGSRVRCRELFQDSLKKGGFSSS